MMVEYDQELQEHGRFEGFRNVVEWGIQRLGLCEYPLKITSNKSSRHAYVTGKQKITFSLDAGGYGRDQWLIALHELVHMWQDVHGYLTCHWLSDEFKVAIKKTGHGISGDLVMVLKRWKCPDTGEISDFLHLRQNDFLRNVLAPVVSPYDYSLIQEEYYQIPRETENLQRIIEIVSGPPLFSSMEKDHVKKYQELLPWEKHADMEADKLFTEYDTKKETSNDWT